MAGHGYHFEHRWDAGEAVGGHPESAQIAMAELDLGCATRSGYITTWYAVDSSYQNQLIEAHRAELDATLADQADVMERVEQTLHGK